MGVAGPIVRSTEVVIEGEPSLTPVSTSDTHVSFSKKSFEGYKAAWLTLIGCWSEGLDGPVATEEGTDTVTFKLNEFNQFVTDWRQSVSDERCRNA